LGSLVGTTEVVPFQIGYSGSLLRCVMWLAIVLKGHGFSRATDIGLGEWL
jgi:hypothetical protein